jgi:hypothetical protein
LQTQKWITPQHTQKIPHIHRVRQQQPHKWQPDYISK